MSYDNEGNEVLAYHSQTRIPGHIGLLVDTGAVFNLSGREYIEIATQAQKTQLDLDRLEQKLTTPKAISGVGNDGTACHVTSTVIGAVAEGELWAYTAPAIYSRGSPICLTTRLRCVECTPCGNAIFS